MFSGKRKYGKSFNNSNIFRENARLEILAPHYNYENTFL